MIARLVLADTPGVGIASDWGVVRLSRRMVMPIKRRLMKPFDLPFIVGGAGTALVAGIATAGFALLPLKASLARYEAAKQSAVVQPPGAAHNDMEDARALQVVGSRSDATPLTAYPTNGTLPVSYAVKRTLAAVREDGGSMREATYDGLRKSARDGNVRDRFTRDRNAGNWNDVRDWREEERPDRPRHAWREPSPPQEPASGYPRNYWQGPPRPWRPRFEAPGYAWRGQSPQPSPNSDTVRDYSREGPALWPSRSNRRQYAWRGRYAQDPANYARYQESQDSERPGAGDAPIAEDAPTRPYPRPSEPY